MSFKKIGFKPETQSPVEVASAHAGRPLVKGIEPWLRERDIYYIDPWPLLESIRPDLKGSFCSLEELHNHYAGNLRYLEIKNDLGLKLAIVRDDGPPSGYILDWFTIKVLNHRMEENSIGGLVETGEYLQELQLRSPDGERLAAYERRILRFSEGNYPVGDYREVLPADDY